MEKDESKNGRDRRAEKFHYPRIESGSSDRSGRVPEKSVVPVDSARSPARVAPPMLVELPRGTHLTSFVSGAIISLGDR